jgi:hypothetical protein
MKNFLFTIAFSLLATTAMASEVYIDQAGGALNVDILQENGNNRINTESNPFDVNGDDINVDITQSGDGNEADLELEMGASQTNLVYSATGDYNTIIGEIYGGINNSFVATIVGSDNAITYCKDYVNSACNGIITNNTDTTTNITGNNNELNFALDSADSVNTVDIGQTTPSDFNVTNLTQVSAAGYDQVAVTIDGDTNTTDIVQNTTGGNNTVTMNIIGNSNATVLNQTSTAGYNQFTMALTGNSNAITVDQQTPMGYTYVNMTVTGDTNTVDILQN